MQNLANTAQIARPKSSPLTPAAVAPNWQHVAAVLARRYDLTRPYARVVAEQAGFGDAP